MWSLVKEFELGKWVELTEGEKVGNCFYIEEAGMSPKSPCGVAARMCKFRCACTREFVARLSNVKNQKSYCGQCENSQNPRQKPPGEATRNELYGGYRRDARRSNRDFELTYEQFKELTSSNCHYCGIAPYTTYRWGEKARSKTDGVIYNGIDRVDNQVGYHTYNCVPCCPVCNNAKATMTVADFLSWVERVYLHQKRGDQVWESEP